MSLPLIIISASCQVLSFVLLLVMFSADSDNSGQIVKINWAEAINAKLDKELDWCTTFYDINTCRGMQLDVHIGGVYAVGYFRVHSSAARDFISDYNVSSFNERCVLPGGEATCAGCQTASDVIITFQTFSLVAHLIAFAMCFVQIKNSATMMDRGVLIATSIALALFGIIMVSTFHDQCFTRLPDSLDAMEGSCYVFCSFQIVLALVAAGLQVALGYQDSPLPRGSAMAMAMPRRASSLRNSKIMTPLVPHVDVAPPAARKPPPFSPISPNGRKLSGSALPGTGGSGGAPPPMGLGTAPMARTDQRKGSTGAVMPAKKTMVGPPAPRTSSFGPPGPGGSPRAPVKSTMAGAPTAAAAGPPKMPPGRMSQPMGRPTFTKPKPKPSPRPRRASKKAAGDDPFGGSLGAL